ncbi:DUF6482 family protein [Thalassotalea mangrovi]|uniref:NADH-quinone reductase n=1 Tax=Thalassotalea mangrovi TaxID=2572245 RepID=A0A4U1B734_9GAMM|nr:DUF6482 family protein [Thalassotalea mangrovi]TKB46311.1 NADH-quinone reductase [Thalassotalea mangrovi]
MDLFIESLEGNTYLVEIGDGGKRSVVTDEQQQPLKFNSLGDIKEHFNEHFLNEVWLEQCTPYEEMCGLVSSGDKLRIRLNW